VLGLENSAVGLFILEKISPPPAGPLTIDHDPTVPAVAERFTDSTPHTGGVLSGPAKAAKQGLFELLKFTKIGLKIRPPQLELGSVPCEIGKLKQLEIDPFPVIAPFMDKFAVHPELNKVAQSVVSVTLKIKLPNNMFGSTSRGRLPTFQITELVAAS
jgi:hypothetical protein